MSTDSDHRLAVSVLAPNLASFDAYPIARRKLRDVIGTEYHAYGSDVYPESASAPKVLDVVWVPAYGRQRRGVVVDVGRKNALVAWIAPSAYDTIRTSRVPFNRCTAEPARAHQ